LKFHGEEVQIQKGPEIRFHTGCGIVADSIPELEHEESLHKAAGLLKAAAQRA
jgi:anthranilate/para-aminobenzoate synthase component I